ncbi:hypothetical protein AB4Y84_20130, partial [Stenotrophomonas sp. 2YAF22]|uniref:hypothetical protein n=1 Tax=Stenotrophomonas sp. 2YAF22 TaxID=3233028 RepID=UPI003F94EAAD
FPTTTVMQPADPHAPDTKKPANPEAVRGGNKRQPKRLAGSTRLSTKIYCVATKAVQGVLPGD